MNLTQEDYRAMAEHILEYAVDGKSEVTAEIDKGDELFHIDGVLYTNYKTYEGGSYGYEKEWLTDIASVSLEIKDVWCDKDGDAPHNFKEKMLMDCLESFI